MLNLSGMSRKGYICVNFYIVYHLFVTHKTKIPESFFDFSPKDFTYLHNFSNFRWRISMPLEKEEGGTSCATFFSLVFPSIMVYF